MNVQFSGHHTYVRKYFQLQVAVKEGEILPPHRAFGQRLQQTKKKRFQKYETNDHKYPSTLRPLVSVKLNNYVNCERI